MGSPSIGTLECWPSVEGHRYLLRVLISPDSLFDCPSVKLHTLSHCMLAGTMTLSIKTLSMKKLSLKTLSIMTLSIMTFSILKIKCGALHDP
jgi:hypothetical protein